MQSLQHHDNAFPRLAINAAIGKRNAMGANPNAQLVSRESSHAPTTPVSRSADCAKVTYAI